MKKSDITTPIINIMLNQPDTSISDKYLNEYLAIGNVYRKLGLSAKEYHIKKLGKQTYCLLGFSRQWVWEFVNYRVYVSKEGITFEVLDGLSIDDAIKCWNDYYQKII